MEKQFTIPEGCKQVSVNQTGESIVITFEPEHQTLKPEYIAKRLYTASPSERKLLLSKLEEQGYRFNEEKCYVEPIKWVPRHREKYEYVTNHGTVLCCYFDEHDSLSLKRLNSGNCFKPETLDQSKVSKRFTEFIANVKKDHGINY